MTKKTEKIKPMFGTAHLTGYQGGSDPLGPLVDWHGNPTGWRIAFVEKLFINGYGETSYKVILAKRVSKRTWLERYAVGYSLGDGMLVRAETSMEWRESLREDRTDHDDLWAMAEQIGTYWAEKDAEAQAELDAENENEENESA